MSNIDKQAVQAVADLKAGYTLGHADVVIIQQMALDAVTLLDELEVVNELFLRAKALMYQSGGTPIENSLNPIDAWLYDAERASAAGKGE
ncbi:hypothetical protein [Enterobacter asburiae]|uniref:hypothetical protein n=1 Tax=Enterobacter asburiae TaxID=61645 RepID=UPI001CBD6623|nr:hypothetical protein [Enterobacter asburiae]UAN14104.1 hypothetical protein KGP20_00085 [Enterobacter asburiae]UAN18583.1 hypothetical protein KGP20_15185 [Enterobacter asburiae]